jgi:putative transposase
MDGSFPIQEEEHLLTVHRSIKSNPVRAGLVERAPDWPWSSAASARPALPTLTPGPAVANMSGHSRFL